MREPIDDEQLAAILDRQEHAAIGFGDGELAEQQRIALDAYYGRPYGDEEAGRSQFVTRDVAEVVDYMTDRRAARVRVRRSRRRVRRSSQGQAR